MLAITYVEAADIEARRVMAHMRVLEWMRYHGAMPHTETLNGPMDDIEEELAFWDQER